jgi:caspase domain-containing protein
MSGKYALIIGNRKYNDRFLGGLKAPEHDVKALAALLRNPSIGDFKVQTMLNPVYSKARSSISQFLSARNTGEIALLYFSGHGVKKDGQVYLAVRDTNYADPGALGIDGAFLKSKMQQCYASGKLLILDCCYSGEFAKMKGSPERKVDTRSEFMGGKGQTILTASDSVSVAREADQAIKHSKFSLFTHYLIEGLRDGKADGADRTPQDGLINDLELYQYAFDNVTKTKRQIPQRLSQTAGQPIVIARNPHFVSANGQPEMPPAPLPRKVFSAQRRRSRHEPQLMAEFDLTSKGRPKAIEESYSIRIFIKDAPQGTRKVVYHLDDSSFKEPVFTIEEGADDFEEYISSYGDVKIIATLHGRKKRKLVRWLSKALKLHYKNNTTEAIEDALDEIIDN